MSVVLQDSSVVQVFWVWEHELGGTVEKVQSYRPLHLFNSLSLASYSSSQHYCQYNRPETLQVRFAWHFFTFTSKSGNWKKYNFIKTIRKKTEGKEDIVHSARQQKGN